MLPSGTIGSSYTEWLLEKSSRRLPLIIITLCALVRHRPAWPPQTYLKSPYLEKNRFIAETTLFSYTAQTILCTLLASTYVLATYTTFANFHLGALGNDLNNVLEWAGSKSHF